MSDAALLFAIACGFTAGIGGLVFGAASGAYRRTALWICAGTALWLFGGLLIDLALSAAKVVSADEASDSGGVSRDVFRFYTEFGVSAVLFFIFVVPFYGFLSARIFPAINEQTIFAVWALFAYLCFVRGSVFADLGRQIAVPGIQWGFLIAGGLGLAAVFAGFRPLALRIALYGWHLGALGFLSYLEWPVIVELFAASDPGTSAVGSRMLWIFFAAMASVVLVFHAWFGLKYLFIIVSCVRGRGRELAADFFQAKFGAPPLSTGIFAALAMLQIAAYAGNAAWDWIPAAALIQASVALVPALLDGRSAKEL
ncbi:MAG: hypothetical protein NXI24_02020 [bacterium]|nr:hypothetical protein [bacterium]